MKEAVYSTFFPEANRQTLDQWYRHWIENYKKDSVKIGTYQSYQQYYNSIIKREWAMSPLRTSTRSIFKIYITILSVPVIPSPPSKSCLPFSAAVWDKPFATVLFRKTRYVWPYCPGNSAERSVPVFPARNRLSFLSTPLTVIFFRCFNFCFVPVFEAERPVL